MQKSNPSIAGDDLLKMLKTLIEQEDVDTNQLKQVFNEKVKEQEKLLIGEE